MKQPRERESEIYIKCFFFGYLKSENNLRARNNNVNLNITLTVRIALYIVTLITILQLYLYSSNSVKIVPMFPVGFLLQFDTKVLRY